MYFINYDFTPLDFFWNNFLKEILLINIPSQNLYQYVRKSGLLYLTPQYIIFMKIINKVNIEFNR